MYNDVGTVNNNGEKLFKNKIRVCHVRLEKDPYGHGDNIFHALDRLTFQNKLRFMGIVQSVA